MVMKKQNKRSIVLKYHPNAEIINVGCSTGDYYEVKDGIFRLGKGKTKNQAWIAAYKDVMRD